VCLKLERSCKSVVCCVSLDEEEKKSGQNKSDLYLHKKKELAMTQRTRKNESHGQDDLPIPSRLVKREKKT
jgi:hypothetical protein